MTVDTMAATNPAMTNGTTGHNDQPAAGWTPRNMEAEMRALCSQLKDKVDAFLATETTDELLQGTQNQVRIAKGVIDDALSRYQ
jgi:hypothetical protein